MTEKLEKDNEQAREAIGRVDTKVEILREEVHGKYE